MSLRFAAVALVLLGAVCAALPGPSAQSKPQPGRLNQEWTPHGRVETNLGIPTRKGSWDGTWFYVNRDMRLALWFRTVGGKLQGRMQYQSTAAPEAFETDWTGTATYYVAGKPATFKLIFDKVTADKIEGRWDWDVQFEDSGRSEKGTFTLQRVNEGRDLGFAFSEFRRELRRGTEVKVYELPQAWVFTKGSKRTVLWDELPF